MKAFLMLLGLTVCSGWAVAQDAGAPFRNKGSVYGLANVGACVHGYAFYGGGGGGEALVYKGLSVGGEGSYNTFSDGWAMGFLTGQAGYHFGDRNRRIGMAPLSPEASAVPSLPPATAPGHQSISALEPPTGSNRISASASKAA